MDMQMMRDPLNRSLVFRSRVKPRMLEGQADKSIVKKDLKNYNGHLYKVFTALPKIDNSAPYMNAYNYVNLKKLKIDADRLTAIDKENQQLLFKINAINRSKATVDCWNVYCRPPGYWRMAHNRRAKRDMRENHRLYNVIQKVNSTYCKKEWKKRWKRMSSNFDEAIHLTKVLHTKKPIDEVLAQEPSLTRGLGLSLTGLPLDLDLPRKKAFLDFQIKDGVRLGQIVVELYQELAPGVVKNFLSHCDEEAEFNYKHCRIHYAEQGKFFALGDITLQNGKGGHSIFKEDIWAPPNGLKHTRQGLLVAMPVTTVPKFDPTMTIRQRIKRAHRKPSYNSQFAITVCPLDPNGQGKERELANAPIFGKIVRGNTILGKINDMLKKHGTPTVTIVVSRCGKIPYTREELEEIRIVRYNMMQEGVEFAFDDSSLDGEEVFEGDVDLATRSGTPRSSKSYERTKSTKSKRSRT